jgi:putative protease
MAEKPVGKVFAFFAKVGVAGIKLDDALKVGDTIHIKGNTTDINMKVDRIEIDRQAVEEAKAGDSIGIKVPGKVRDHDVVYVVEGE